MSGEVREVVTRTEPYMRMDIEKKTGKYASVTVGVSFLCPPEQFLKFRARALEEVRDTLNVLTADEEAEP